jgi:hypothetical protein
LTGGGYPSYTHIQKIRVTGTVPLLKLHGSVSWSVQGQSLVRYHDCRPVINGTLLAVGGRRGREAVEVLLRRRSNLRQARRRRVQLQSDVSGSHSRVLDIQPNSCEKRRGRSG